MDTLTDLGNNMIYILITIFKYFISTIIAVGIYKVLKSRLISIISKLQCSINRILFLAVSVEPFLIIFIPVITLLLPIFSGAFALFLLGLLLFEGFGVKPGDSAMSLAPISIKHGRKINLISHMIMALGIIWGIYNILGSLS